LAKYTLPITPPRSASMQRLTTGHERRWLPMWMTLPVRRCASISSSPSRGVWPHGFST
jgi:hypothetical protein